MLGGLYLLSMIIVSIYPPLFSPHDPWEHSFKPLSPPNFENWFGTDQMGRDIFSRVVWGARASFLIALIAVCVSTFFGTMVGILSGYAGGKIDYLAMRLTDTVIVMPSFFIYIVIITAMRIQSATLIAVVMGFVMWTRVAKIVRSEVLSLKQREFVIMTKAMGANISRIVLRHLLPNTLSSVIVVATVNMGHAVLSIAGLGFLGLGDPSSLDWGTQLLWGRNLIRNSWWCAIFPGLALLGASLSMNVLGDGLRDALDPKLRR